MKRLVVLFDGTWNKPGNEDEITNVVKLHRFIPDTDAQGVRQLTHYVVGIATEDLGRLTFTVGAIGFGVGDRMQRGYKFLCENYEDGDEIYVIGFSRGAFQARSLAGLVALAGIARSVAPETVAAVWDCYEQNKLSPDAKRLEELRAGASYPVRIKCVGVWDTVGNLGIPFVRKGLIKELLGFHDTELSPLVDVGLHALAIDEPRGPFEPTLWTLKRGATLPEGQIVEQVWFPGSHANVGGGFKDSRLSDIALLWMAERMTQTTSLAIDLAGLRNSTKPDPLGELVSPTSDGVYRVSHIFPFVRLIKQNREGISPLQARPVRNVAHRRRAGRPGDGQRGHPRERSRPLRQARAAAARRDREPGRLPPRQPRRRARQVGPATQRSARFLLCRRHDAGPCRSGTAPGEASNVRAQQGRQHFGWRAGRDRAG